MTPGIVNYACELKQMCTPKFIFRRQVLKLLFTNFKAAVCVPLCKSSKK